MEQIISNKPNDSVRTPHYVVLQVALLEEASMSNTRHIAKLEEVINSQAQKGYRLHTLATESSETTGRRTFMKMQATMVFEKLP